MASGKPIAKKKIPFLFSGRIGFKASVDLISVALTHRYGDIILKHG
jgi:hypothetical protein